jgi:ribonuclease J
VFIDGKGVGDVGEMVIKDRRHLSQDGMVLAVIAIAEKTGEVIYGPDVITRGVVFEDESEGLLDDATAVGVDTLNSRNKEDRGA